MYRVTRRLCWKIKNNFWKNVLYRVRSETFQTTTVKVNHLKLQAKNVYIKWIVSKWYSCSSNKIVQQLAPLFSNRKERVQIRWTYILKALFIHDKMQNYFYFYFCFGVEFHVINLCKIILNFKKVMSTCVTFFTLVMNRNEMINKICNKTICHNLNEGTVR